ncbi:MAG: IS982 family transposase [Melioribacteraceae bacterium]
MIISNLLKDSIDKKGNFHKLGRTPKFSDLEVIALSLTSEILSIDSENFLFIKLNAEYKKQFPNLINRRKYNIRRRNIALKIEEVRKLLSKKIIESENIFIIDTMPLEVCKLARANRAKICKQDFETLPDKGFCASQNTYFFGYKLHGLCTIDGVFTAYDLTKASVHDIHYLNDVKEYINNAFLLADKAYLSENIQIDLFHSENITLETPLRSNQYNYKKQHFILRKSRKRIETLFSQLCDQFMIHRNYAKSFSGYSTRIISKITVLTTLQYINKFFTFRPLNHIKHALA